MFRAIALHTGEERPKLEIFIEGRPIEAYAGDTLAATLLSAGVVPFRFTPVSGQPRAPLCLMGVCFDCLVEVDGAQNVQACMVLVRAGMQVRLQNGARRASGDFD